MCSFAKSMTPLNGDSVVLGRSDDVAVEILEGIVPDDMVAVSGAMALQTGYAALR
jgi:hypothetical protein